MSALATSLQAWFTDRLIRERNASPHTIASYRDTIRLLLTYASQKLGVEPSRLELGQLDAPLVGAFLDHLETDRGCGARTRNTRLAAIRTFYRYCMLRHPEHAATIERVLQIGPKRHEGRWSPISPSASSTRSSTPPTAQAGPAAATTQSSSCSPRRGFGRQS
jgi:integrase/recombinase XerD